MYGGSIENRAQLIFEAVDLVLSSLPLSQVGIRLSPVSETFGCKDSAPRETYGYDLVYLSVVERRGIHADNTGVSTNGVAHHFRSIYNGVLNTAAGIDHVGAMQIVEDGAADLVALLVLPVPPKVPQEIAARVTRRATQAHDAHALCIESMKGVKRLDGL
ncbi:Aldolase-type TIM barrel [Phytophthora cactorum]|nr:Aldolase-type TIM barrel [Phytophthora cactorum]